MTGGLVDDLIVIDCTVKLVSQRRNLDLHKGMVRTRRRRNTLISTALVTSRVVLLSTSLIDVFL